MPDIPVGAQVFDIVFHPIHSTVYTALLGGEIKSFTYDQHGQHGVGFTQRPFKRSCRGLALNEDGSRLWAAGNSKTLYILDAENGKVSEKRSSAHNSAINRVKHLTSWVVATGDDDGVIKLWDPRKPDAIRSYMHHSDFISDFLWVEDKKHLVAISADGTLSVVDVRSKKNGPLVQSDDHEEELLCIIPVERGENYAVGTQSGLSIFKKKNSWNRANRVAGRSCSVDSLCALPSSHPFSGSRILTGLGNGQLCIEQLSPAKLIDVISNHGKFPVERIAVDHGGEGTWVASAGSEESLRLTQLKLVDDENNGDNDRDDDSGRRGTLDKHSQRATDEITDQDAGRLASSDRELGDQLDIPKKKRKRNQDRDVLTRKKKGRAQIEAPPSFFAGL